MSVYMIIFDIEKINVILRYFNLNKYVQKLFQINDIFKGFLSKKFFVCCWFFKEMYSYIFNYRINGQKIFVIIN